MGVDYEKFKEQLLKEKTRMQSDYGEESDEDEDAGDEESMYNPYRQNGPAKSDTPVLDNFGIDITKAAEEAPPRYWLLMVSSATIPNSSLMPYMATMFRAILVAS